MNGYLINLSEILKTGHFGDVLDSGGTFTFDLDYVVTYIM